MDLLGLFAGAWVTSRQNITEKSHQACGDSVLNFLYPMRPSCLQEGMVWFGGNISLQKFIHGLSIYSLLCIAKRWVRNGLTGLDLQDSMI